MGLCICLLFIHFIIQLIDNAYNYPVLQYQNSAFMYLVDIKLPHISHRPAADTNAQDAICAHYPCNVKRFELQLHGPNAYIAFHQYIYH